jgi:hypothetical protein
MISFSTRIFVSVPRFINILYRTLLLNPDPKSLSSLTRTLVGGQICVHAVAEWGSYFSNFWNWLDLTVLLVCLVVLILTLDHPLGKHPPAYASASGGGHEGGAKSSLDIAAMALRYVLQFSRLAVLWNFERERQEESATRGKRRFFSCRVVHVACVCVLRSFLFGGAFDSFCCC